MPDPNNLQDLHILLDVINYPIGNNDDLPEISLMKLGNNPPDQRMVLEQFDL